MEVLAMLLLFRVVFKPLYKRSKKDYSKTQAKGLIKLVEGEK